MRSGARGLYPLTASVSPVASSLSLCGAESLTRGRSAGSFLKRARDPRAFVASGLCRLARN